MENKLEFKKELLSVKEDIIQMTNDSEKASELINKLLKIKEDVRTKLNASEQVYFGYFLTIINFS